MAVEAKAENTRDSTDDWGSVAESPSNLLRSGPAYLRDRFFYRVVGSSLAVLAGLALVGAIVLAAYDKTVPDFVVALGSTAIGALAGVLVADRR